MNLGDVTMPLSKLAIDHPWLKAIVTAGGGVVSWLFPGAWDKKAVFAVITLLLLDFVTGITAAWASGQRLQSAKAKRWVGRFIGYAVAILIAALIPRLMEGLSSYQEVMVAMICGPMVATELISLIENLEKLNVPGVDVLRRLLQRPAATQAEVAKD